MLLAGVVGADSMRWVGFLTDKATAGNRDAEPLPPQLQPSTQLLLRTGPNGSG